MPKLLVELTDGMDLRAMVVDTHALLELPYEGLWLVGPGPGDNATIDLQTRVFFPRLGLPEDHVSERDNPLRSSLRYL